MARLPPDHRALAVFEVARVNDVFDGIHAYESALFHLLRGRECPLRDVEDALEWYRDESVRHLLDALMLGKASDDMIGKTLDMAPESLAPYRHLFFDRSVFRHAIEALRYVVDVDCPENLREYYNVSVHQGPEFLAAQFCVGRRPEVDPRAVKRAVLADQYSRFLAHRGHPTVVDGKPNVVVQEAMRYGAAAVTTAIAIIDKGENGSDAAITRLQIILEGKATTKTPAELGISPKEIVG